MEICFHFNEGEGQAVREYTTDSGPADFVLFGDRKPVGITEAKKETLGHNITTVEDQTIDLDTQDATVRRNFQTWIMQKNAGIPTEQKFTEAQTAFLQLIREHIMTSLRFERDDLDFAPFDAQGGLGKMHQFFGNQRDELIEELKGELVA